MTSYFVDVSPGVARQVRAGTRPMPDGFRLISAVRMTLAGDERWLAEDDGAPDVLQGLVVEPVFSWGAGKPLCITDRRLAGAPRRD